MIRSVNPHHSIVMSTTTNPKSREESVQRRRSVVVPESRNQAYRQTVCFELSEPKATDVFLAGSFNDWDATSLALENVDGNGHFRAEVPLLPGCHEYKFVVDGDWTADPRCPRWTINEYGSLNSVLEIDQEKLA